ncbi:MAG: DUF4032 domain-containing protein [Candidatus Omnitrophica bacterium]|nr:DUF4032 domain-containing protein [Candidatus Omnitrophota bacterium]
MITPEMRELINDPRVKEEINKHRWYESERKGSDVGLDYAVEDWLRKYSLSWMKRNISLERTETVWESIKKVFNKK